MKIHFLNKLLSQPWHIGRDGGRRILGQIIAGMRSERSEVDVMGDPLPALQIVGDVAVLPMWGTFAMDVPDWVKAYGFGLTDVNDVEEELVRALNDPAVSMIVLDCDSPGGLAIAGQKCFDLVEAANKKKPVFGWAADGHEMASACYQGCAPCRAILTGKYATVGSIGSYSMMADETEFWRQMGISWEVFRSGEFKAIGEDPLTTEQREYLQGISDEFGARFRKNVAKYRTDVTPEDMRGQWFFGEDAAKRGFTGGTAKDLNGAIGKFRRMV